MLLLCIEIRTRVAQLSMHNSASQITPPRPTTPVNKGLLNTKPIMTMMNSECLIVVHFLPMRRPVAGSQPIIVTLGASYPMSISIPPSYSYPISSLTRISPCVYSVVCSCPCIVLLCYFSLRCGLRKVSRDVLLYSQSKLSANFELTSCG